MKISPVAGTPTIPQPNATGLSPDKLARIKGIAQGQVHTAPPTEEEKQKLLNATQKITMNTNANPTLVTPEATGTEIGEPKDTEMPGESIIPDPNVQATPATEVTEPISPQLAAIARQKRALQVKEQELAEREKALTGQPKVADLEARLKATPLRVLQELGVTYDQLTQEILGQPAPNPEAQEKIRALEEKISALEKGVDSRFSEAQESQETAAVNYVADKYDALVANGEEFELLKAADGAEEVIRRVYLHWKKTGQELDVAKVAREYQEELAEEAAKYAKLKMVQGKLTPQEPAPVTPTQTSQPGMKTLTNKDSARPTMDRKQRAILAMQGQLKR